MTDCFRRPAPMRVALAGLFLTSSLALAACSSSGSGGSGGSGTTSTDPPASTGTSSTASSTASTPATAPSGSGTPADAATKAAVTKAYETFFNPKSTTAESVASIQNGDKLKAAIEKEAKTPTAQSASAKVSEVRLLSPNIALVTFTILSAGQPVLPDTHGDAVQVNGTWVVAAQTFCALLQLEGSPPAACNDPSVTSLPTS